MGGLKKTAATLTTLSVLIEKALRWGLSVGSEQ